VGQVSVPREDDFSALADRWRQLGANKEVVGQVDLVGGARLAQVERSVEAADVDVGETELNDHGSDSVGKTLDFAGNSLLDTVIDDELNPVQVA